MGVGRDGSEVPPSFHEALDYLSKGIQLFLDARPTPEVADIGTYESDKSTYALAFLVLMHVDGVIDLGRESPQHLAPAAACARAAFETASNLAWIAQPGEPFEREGRWLGWYVADARFWENLSRDLAGRAPAVAAEAGRTAAAKAKWATAIGTKLREEKGFEQVSFPKLEDRLASFGHESLYITYRYASQIVHGMPDATKLVMTERSTGLCYGVEFDASSWATILRMSWWSLHISLPLALVRVGAEPHWNEFESHQSDFLRCVAALELERSNGKTDSRGGTP